MCDMQTSTCSQPVNDFYGFFYVVHLILMCSFFVRAVFLITGMWYCQASIMRASQTGRHMFLGIGIPWMLAPREI